MKISIETLVTNCISNLTCINELDGCLDVDLLTSSDNNTFDEMFDVLREQVEGLHEYIYYANAMDYLRTNDVMLTESLEYASDLGFETKNLNSCILATIHAQCSAMEEIYKEQSEIEQIYNLCNELLSAFETEDVNFEIDSEDVKVIEIVSNNSFDIDDVV